MIDLKLTARYITSLIDRYPNKDHQVPLSFGDDVKYYVTHAILQTLVIKDNSVIGELDKSEVNSLNAFIDNPNLPEPRFKRRTSTPDRQLTAQKLMVDIKQTVQHTLYNLVLMNRQRLTVEVNPEMRGYIHSSDRTDLKIALDKEMVVVSHKGKSKIAVFRGGKFFGLKGKQLKNVVAWSPVSEIRFDNLGDDNHTITTTNTPELFNLLGRSLSFDARSVQDYEQYISSRPTDKLRFVVEESKGEHPVIFNTEKAANYQFIADICAAYESPRTMTVEEYD